MKSHAVVANTDPERIKITMQNIYLEKKALKSEIEQTKFEI